MADKKQVKYSEEFKQTIVNLYQSGKTKEETNRRSYSSFEELNISLFKYIIVFYNSIRSHSHNNGFSPKDFELNYK